MRKVELGKTGLEVTKAGFGALPIQRCSVDDAVSILQKAYDAGINFYDTARAYSDSEYKIGQALGDVRKNIIIATKTHAKSLEEMKRHIDESLQNLKTDYIDIYQFHFAKQVFTEDNDMYQYMLELKKQNVIGHIGITVHSNQVGYDAVASGLYDTLQYPVNCISHEKDIEIIDLCRKKKMGFIAMKGMAGGLIDNPKTAFAFYEQYNEVVPIWGVQTISELQDFIDLDNNPPVVDDEIKAQMIRYKEMLGTDFCRGCGYCVSSCPQNIEINNCARMTLLCGRAVWQDFVTEEWQRKMRKIEDCTNCGACMQKCPYNLDVPRLLAKNLQEYKKFIDKRTD